MSIPRVMAVLLSPALLIGCGSPPADVSTPASRTKADVTLTFDGVRHACVVALPTEAQGSAVACADVVPFFKDELRLANGSAYEVHTIAPVDEAEKKRVLEELARAGFRSIN